MNEEQLKGLMMNRDLRNGIMATIVSIVLMLTLHLTCKRLGITLGHRWIGAEPACECK